MAKLPTRDDWKNFRGPAYEAALRATAEAFIALRTTLRHGPPQIYRTATRQLAQAPMEWDGGENRYCRARYRLQSYRYGAQSHGEHPYTKKRTKELIAQIIDRAAVAGTPHEVLVDSVMTVLDVRQTTVLMNHGDQHKKAGLIRSGDGLVERYLPTIIVDRRDGRVLTEAEVRQLQAAKERRWQAALAAVTHT